MKFSPLLRSERGQIARLFLVLAAIVLFVGLITFLLISAASKPAAPTGPETPTVVLPVYEKQLGNIRFVFLSAFDRGNTLKASEVTNQNFFSQKDLVTTERYVVVTVGAQNKGQVNTEQNAWDLGDVIDEAGNHFVALDSYLVNGWLPADNSCGKLLKPSFDPTPCTKIYEVAKSSKGLKVQVATGENNNSANDLSSGHKLTFEMDMVIK